MHRIKRTGLTLRKSAILLWVPFLLAINLLLYAFFKIDLSKNLLRALCALLCVVYLLLTRRIGKTEFILLLIAAYLIVINGDVSFNMAYMIILSVSLATCKRERVIDNYNKVHILVIIIVAISLFTGIVENDNWTYLGRTRNSFGFSHVNYVGLLMFSAGSLYLLSRKTIKWLDLVGCVVASYIVFRYSDSRTGFIGTLILICLLLCFRFISSEKIKILVTIIITLFFFSPLLWRLPQFNSVTVNQLLSNRPRLFSYYINKNSLINLIFGGSKAGEVDNGFLMLLFNCGFVIYLGIYAAVLRSAIIKTNNRRSVEVAFIIATLSVAVMESSIIRPELPCMVFFWTTVVADLKPSSTKENDNN